MRTKTIAAILVICLMLAVPCVSCHAQTVYGDANRDGRVTSADARMTLRVAAGLEQNVDRTALDVNGDGGVTSADARLVLRRASRLISVFPVEYDVSNELVSESINAECGMLYDVQADRVLYNYYGSKRKSPASLTKLLTALTALKYCSPDMTVRIGDEIYLIAEDSSTCDLWIGMEMPLRSLIKAMLAASGNDAAYCVAVSVAKQLGEFETNEKAANYFIGLMNQLAQELGMKDSHFNSPDGYDAEGQYITAADLVILAKAALKNELIMQGCGARTVEAQLTNGQTVSWSNSNQMLNPGSMYYRSEVTGLKTGMTSTAGCNIIVTFKRGGKDYIAVVLGASSADARYSSAITLMDMVPNGN